MAATSADIGLIGLAVMGENLVLNMESHGYTVAVFNRTRARVDEFLAGRAAGKRIVGCHSVKELVGQLKRPRKVMIMVKAGPAVDQVIDEVAPLLEPGDILIDGGNTHYPDTTRRTKALEERKLLFIGTGVSGGEEGALLGPSIMPGGDPAAWPHVKPIFQAIAAKAPDGSPCCDWVGAEGAGHYVKMVHNGIEYGDMQLIGEAYHLLSGLAGLDADGLHEVFAALEHGAARQLLDRDHARHLRLPRSRERQAAGRSHPRRRRPEGDRQVDGQLRHRSGDTADAHHGGGVRALPVRAEGGARRRGQGTCTDPTADSRATGQALIQDVEMALYASKIISYAQGFALLRAMAKESGWTINNGAVALMWRGGCIIRSVFLGKIKEAFDRNPRS